MEVVEQPVRSNLGQVTVHDAGGKGAFRCSTALDRPVRVSRRASSLQPITAEGASNGSVRIVIGGSLMHQRDVSAEMDPPHYFRWRSLASHS